MSPARRRALTHGLGLTLLLVVMICVVRTQAAPPARLAQDGRAASDFQAERAMAHLRVLTQEPRPVGSPGHDRARRYLLGELSALGLATSELNTRFACRIAGGVASSDVHDLMGRLVGTAGQGQTILLAAHYDSVSAAPGAGDDASGVVTLLEAARVLVQGPRLEHDVLFLLTDAEEVGMLGAQAFVAEVPAARDVRLALNFDARGSRGVVTMFDTSVGNGPLIDGLRAAPYAVASSFVSTLSASLPNDTDASIFKRAHIPTYSFAFADGLENYHRATDSAENLDEASIAHAGSYAVSLVRHWGRRDLSQLSSEQAEDVVYFDLFGRVLVTYSLGAARAWALVTLGLVLALSWLKSKDRGTSVGSTGRSSGKNASRWFRAFGFALAAVLAAVAMTALAGAGLSRVIPWYFLAANVKVFVAGLLLWVSALLTALYGRATRSSDLARAEPFDEAGKRAPIERRADRELGAALLWSSPLAILAAVAPATSAPFQWPLLFAVLGMGGEHCAQKKYRGEASAQLFALLRYLTLVPAAAIMTQLVYATLVATGASMPFVPALFWALLMIWVIPLASLSPAEARVVAISLGALGALLLVIGLTRTRFDEQQPKTDSLAYGIDLDTGDSRWLSFDGDADRWTATRIPLDAEWRVLPAFTRWAEPLRTAKAVREAREGAAVTIGKLPRQASPLESDLRVPRGVTVSIEPRDARCFELWQVSGPLVGFTLLHGKRVQSFVRFSSEFDEQAIRVMTGDRSRRGWHMKHCGEAGSPVQVALGWFEDGDVTLRLVERIDGFPVLPGQDALAPRPPSLVPAETSDVILLSRPMVLAAPPP